jgi:hypothetical protein
MLWMDLRNKTALYWLDKGEWVGAKVLPNDWIFIVLKDGGSELLEISTLLSAHLLAAAALLLCIFGGIRKDLESSLLINFTPFDETGGAWMIGFLFP